jgi:NAD(P)-dependent dehydrogenase (short-subunit alcohol dehydrogenase family)
MALDGKVAIVTGGAQGIGQAYSERLAREGAAVGIIDLRTDQAQSVAASIRDRGGRAAAYRADVSNQDEMDNVVAQVIEEFGRVDVLINNAAIYGDIDWSDNSLDYLRKVLDVNLIGILVCSRAVFPAMKRQRGGSIINISSIAAYPWPWGRTRDADALAYLNATAEERQTWSWEPAEDLETIPSSAYGLGKWQVGSDLLHSNNGSHVGPIWHSRQRDRSGRGLDRCNAWRLEGRTPGRGHGANRLG